jgi:hypothetical protein
MASSRAVDEAEHDFRFGTGGNTLLVMQEEQRFHQRFAAKLSAEFGVRIEPVTVDFEGRLHVREQ